MSMKKALILFALFIVFGAASAMSVQETESAVSSALTGISLPNGAARDARHRFGGSQTDVR